MLCIPSCNGCARYKKNVRVARGLVLPARGERPLVYEDVSAKFSGRTLDQNEMAMPV